MPPIRPSPEPARPPRHRSQTRADGRLVPWSVLGRRLLVTVAVIVGAAAAGGIVATAVGRGAIGTWLGTGLLVAVIAGALIVAGSALRGMLLAGERGERLAGRDVGVLPPQTRRRPRR